MQRYIAAQSRSCISKVTVRRARTLQRSRPLTHRSSPSLARAGGRRARVARALGWHGGARGVRGARRCAGPARWLASGPWPGRLGAGTCLCLFRPSQQSWGQGAQLRRESCAAGRGGTRHPEFGAWAVTARGRGRAARARREEGVWEGWGGQAILKENRQACEPGSGALRDAGSASCSTRGGQGAGCRHVPGLLVRWGPGGRHGGSQVLPPRARSLHRPAEQGGPFSLPAAGTGGGEMLGCTQGHTGSRWRRGHGLPVS